MPSRHRNPGLTEPDPTLDDLRGQRPEELHAIIARIGATLADLHVGDDGELRELSDGEQDRFDRLSRLRDRAEARLREHEHAVAVYSRNPNAVQRWGDPGQLVTRGGWATAPGADPSLAQFRSAAMAMLDRHRANDVLSASAADRADAVLRSGDPHALTARYLAAVGSPDYAVAFGKMLADPMTGHLRFSAEEVGAVREVSAAAAAAEYRAGPMVTSATGFPLPLTVDPSILITGTGAQNPIRGLARVTTVGTHDWVGVSAAGVTASYDQEGTEVSDDTPDLAAPKISTYRGTAWVPFTIEASQDWPTLQSEMARLIDDARNVLDSTMFLSGNGTNQPFGVLGGDSTYSLTTTQRVLTATSANLAVADPWSLKAQIPPRFLARARFAGNPAMLDKIFRFVGGGNTTEPPQFAGMDRGGDFLGAGPAVEWSDLVTTTTTGSKVLVGGDWATAYRIVDRLGMSAELVPHVFGASHRPTGSRGLFCFWRTGAGVTAANALRYLEVK